MEAATENERRPTVDRRGGKAVREAAGLMPIAAGGDLASQRQERVGRGIEVPDREVHGRPSARPYDVKTGMV